jgi:hypothetical protein
LSRFWKPVQIYPFFTSTFSDVTQNINSTFAHLGAAWGFGQSGDVANYFVRDTTNQRFWRITLMVGASFNYNFIIIERLY